MLTCKTQNIRCNLLKSPETQAASSLYVPSVLPKLPVGACNDRLSGPHTPQLTLIYAG